MTAKKVRRKSNEIERLWNAPGKRIAHVSKSTVQPEPFRSRHHYSLSVDSFLSYESVFDKRQNVRTYGIFYRGFRAPFFVANLKPVPSSPSYGSGDQPSSNGAVRPFLAVNQLPIWTLNDNQIDFTPTSITKYAVLHHLTSKLDTRQSFRMSHCWKW